MSVVMMIYLAGVVEGMKLLFVLGVFIGLVCVFTNLMFHKLEGGEDL